MGLINYIKRIFAKRKIKIGKFQLILETNNPHEKQYLNSIINDDYLISKLLIKKGDRVLDLGANIGFTALIYLNFGADFVKCYEPVPELASRIRRINSKQIEVVEKAIGDKIGKALINLSTSHNQGHSLNDQWPEKFKNVFQNTKEIQIEVTTLDFDLNKEKFDFIKIDVEGNEANAIKGGKSFFETNKNSVVQIEIYDWQFQETHSLLSNYYTYTYVPLIKDNEILDLISITDLQDVKLIKFNNAPNYLYSNRKISLNDD